jgi:hypothetical protein
MARSEPQVNLRMPAELKDALDLAAAQNMRSLTAEVVSRLQASVEGSTTRTPPEDENAHLRANAEDQRRVLRLIGYSLLQVSNRDDADSADLAELKTQLRNLAITLGNSDLHKAGVEASELMYLRETVARRAALHRAEDTAPQTTPRQEAKSKLVRRTRPKP